MDYPKSFVLNQKEIFIRKQMVNIGTPEANVTRFTFSLHFIDNWLVLWFHKNREVINYVWVTFCHTHITFLIRGAFLKETEFVKGLYTVSNLFEQLIFIYLLIKKIIQP